MLSRFSPVFSLSKEKQTIDKTRRGGTRCSSLSDVLLRTASLAQKISFIQHNLCGCWGSTGTRRCQSVGPAKFSLFCFITNACPRQMKRVHVRSVWNLDQQFGFGVDAAPLKQLDETTLDQKLCCFHFLI